MADRETEGRAARAEARVRPGLEKALNEKDLEYGAPVFIRIFKESSELELWVRKPGEQTFELFRIYEICYWSGQLGPKLKEGDGQAPEGFYFVSQDRMNPASRFHLSFNLGYPNAYERAHGYTGSALMVHGNCVSIGCYAMTDERIEEIYSLCQAALGNGQPYFRVHSFPFRMTAQRMEKAKRESGALYGFWENLKDGYDYFEEKGAPPKVTVAERRYHFD